MATPLSSFDRENAGNLDGFFGNVRVPMRPSDLLVAGSARLLERENLPLTVRQALHSFKKDSRRVAADRSAFGFLVNAMMYAQHPANALFFPRLVEAEVYGRCELPALVPDVAHESESDANRGFDVAQINIRSRRNQTALDELLYAALVQEVATKAVAASEASELRVRSVLMGRA